jgi:hypothetical protein
MAHTGLLLPRPATGTQEGGWVMRCFILLFTAVWILSTPAFSTTYVVKPDGSGDFPTIQDAINAAVDGDWKGDHGAIQE